MHIQNIKNTALAVLSAVGSVIASALGGWDAALGVLLGMMAADYLSGLALAIAFRASPKTEGGAFSSAVSFRGLMRKLSVLVVVWVGVMLDRVLAADYVRTAVILFFTANEGLSVLENTALMGVPYPAFVKSALEALRQRAGEGEKEE